MEGSPLWSFYRPPPPHSQDQSHQAPPGLGLKGSFGYGGASVLLLAPNVLGESVPLLRALVISPVCYAQTFRTNYNKTIQVML